MLLKEDVKGKCWKREGMGSEDSNFAKKSRGWGGAFNKHKIVTSQVRFDTNK